MYKAMVSVDGKNTVVVEGVTPTALGAAIGSAITADPRGELVDVVYEVTGPLSRKSVISELILVSVEPEDEDTGVTSDSSIILTFNNPIKGNKVSVATASGVAVTGLKIWSSNKRVLTFTPAQPLSGDTEYVVTITGVVDVYNQELAEEVVSFTTAPNALALVSIVPADKATEVPINSTVVITFNNEIASNNVSVATSSDVPVDGTKTWDAAKKVLTFTPTLDLSEETKYIVTIASVVDVYTQTLATVTKEFTTVHNG